MSFLLDTNILSARLRRPSGLAHCFVQYSGRLYTSSVVPAELFVWAAFSPSLVAGDANRDAAPLPAASSA